MINLETILTVAGAFGGLEALKWLAGLKNNRRKGEAEIADSIEGIVAKRMQGYEETIIFFQGQLKDKEAALAELQCKYSESMQQVLKLTQQLGEMKLRYHSSRCDRRNCRDRKPPFKWMLRSREAKGEQGTTEHDTKFGAA